MAFSPSPAALQPSRRTNTQASNGVAQGPKTSELKQKRLPSKEAVKAAISLKQRGWASIEGVLNQEECTAYQDGFWDWMEDLGTGVKRNDPATWQYPQWPPSYRGIINSLEVAHQAFVWKVRKHPNVVQIFADLWGSEALLSSFDSINALPSTQAPPSESWLHVDQAPHRRGIACIQGLVNLVDVGPDSTGTLLVKDGSHAAHHSFFEEVSQMSPEEQKACIDHYKFTPEEVGYWDGYKAIGVKGGAGSMFLWDSRAVHANIFPEATKGMRHVVYTCYQPASLASKADLEQKKTAYEQYRLTTHWPAMNIRLYDDDSAVEYYGATGDTNRPRYQVHRTRAAVEDRHLLQLAGVLPYTEEEAIERPALVNMTEQELESLLYIRI